MRQKIILPLIIILFSGTLQSYHVVSDDPYFRPGYSFTVLYAALNDTTLNFRAFEIALKGQRILMDAGYNKKPGLLTLIDYSRPSSEKRLYIIDLENYRIINSSLVAHGRNSGDLYATRFSNKMKSYQSALGFYITGDTYNGGQGYSMLMAGLDTGYNDNAAGRAIVMHGAGYVSSEYIERYGRSGRSLGCPAIPVNLNRQIIDKIKQGSVLFCYYPDSVYLKKSVILNRN